MVDPIMHTIHFECSDCGQVGFGVRPHGAGGYNISDGFHVEPRDGVEVIVCKCGKMVLPPEENSN
jgi:hypothetical protein